MSQQLSRRELEILKLMAEGKDTKAIAVTLGMTVNTECVHRSHIMKKLGIHEASRLVHYAVWNGLLLP